MLGVTQHGLNLFSIYAGKPFEEVIHTGAVFEIREQSLDRNARAHKDPGSADLLRRPFNRRACAPIKHGKRLTDAAHDSKFVCNAAPRRPLQWLSHEEPNVEGNGSGLDKGV